MRYLEYRANCLKLTNPSSEVVAWCRTQGKRNDWSPVLTFYNTGYHLQYLTRFNPVNTLGASHVWKRLPYRYYNPYTNPDDVRVLQGFTVSHHGHVGHVRLPFQPPRPVRLSLELELTQHVEMPPYSMLHVVINCWSGSDYFLEIKRLPPELIKCRQ